MYFPVARGMKIAAARNLRGGSRRQRQEHAHTSAVSKVAANVDKPTVGSHDLVHGRQTQTGSLPGLCSEERLKHVGTGGRIHAVPVVLDHKKCARQQSL